MENSTFKIQASISFLESFVTSHFFGIFRKKLSLNLPVVPEKFILSVTALNQLNKSISIKNIDITFLDTAKGKEFLTRYLEELRLLKPEYRDLLVTESVTHLFSYSLDVIVDNKSSHAKPVTLDAFELYGTKQLMHTARVLKQPSAPSKPLILNNDADENFTEDYVYLADYWAVKDGAMEFHYQDWESDDDAEAEKMHQSTVDSSSFISQFNRIAHEITDILKKVANALNVDINSLE